MGFMRADSQRRLAALFFGAALAFSACFARAEPPVPDVVLRSTPATIVWGHYAADVAPALRVRSGTIVRIDTVSPAGLFGVDPVAFFGAAGIPAKDVLPDVVAIARSGLAPPGGAIHILTGPIYVEGAEPGDVLEVRILAVEPRVAYGVNNPGAVTGVLPAAGGHDAKIVRLDLERKLALFSDEVALPLAPFQGIMAVAPPAELGHVSTRPPGPWGGNLDFRRLRAGSTLYLPVFNKGALFYTGDPHGVQGDGEVNGNALDVSNSVTVQLIVHKIEGAHLRVPRAEDRNSYYVFGLDPSLAKAMLMAVEETIRFLGETKELSSADAYALASMAVNYRVGEVVDGTKMVYGVIPKNIFKQQKAYWLP